MKRFIWVIFFCFFGTMGCSTIPKDIQQRALPTMPFPELIKQTPKNIDQTVILGGYILEVRPQKHKTQIFAIEAPLDDDLKPASKTLSKGILILNYHGVLDPAKYPKDRKITVAGELRNSSATKMYQVPYPFVEMRVTHIHAWPE